MGEYMQAAQVIVEGGKNDKDNIDQIWSKLLLDVVHIAQKEQ